MNKEKRKFCSKCKKLTKCCSHWIEVKKKDEEIFMKKEFWCSKCGSKVEENQQNGGKK